MHVHWRRPRHGGSDKAAGDGGVGAVRSHGKGAGSVVVPATAVQLRQVLRPEAKELAVEPVEMALGVGGAP